MTARVGVPCLLLLDRMAMAVLHEGFLQSSMSHLVTTLTSSSLERLIIGPEEVDVIVVGIVLWLILVGKLRKPKKNRSYVEYSYEFYICWITAKILYYSYIKKPKFNLSVNWVWSDSLSAGRTSKSEKRTLWVMGPHKVQSWTSTMGVQFLSILSGWPRSNIGLQKVRVTWKHLKRGIGGGGYWGHPQNSGFGENLISNILR